MTEKSESKTKKTALADPVSSKPVYTNWTGVTRTKLIFQIDFLHNNQDQAILLGRYMMPPIQAKRLRNSLSEMIAAHEKEHGEIQETDNY